MNQMVELCTGLPMLATAACALWTDHSARIQASGMHGMCQPNLQQPYIHTYIHTYTNAFTYTRYINTKQNTSKILYIHSHMYNST